LFSLILTLSKRLIAKFPEPSPIILLSKSKLTLLLKLKIMKVGCLDSFLPKVNWHNQIMQIWNGWQRKKFVDISALKWRAKVPWNGRSSVTMNLKKFFRMRY
jgi:hypothetical protein